MNDTREFIIDEAYKLFLQQSYEAVSISTISEAIGLTKGALYHHFTNKEDLFKAVIDKHFPHFNDESAPQAQTLKEQIEMSVAYGEKILRSLNPQGMKFDPVSFIGLMSDAFRHYPEFDKRKIEEIDECTKMIKNVVVKAIASGEIRGDIDTTVIAKQIVSTSIGTAIEIMHNYSIEETVNTMRAELQQLYALLKL
ncbi:MAG: TetR/AcrR family transcriptional regulator [Salinivirgaceae bacterium]|nr:TetR/AcrR family transcriptional regulator [Salinivirgaceae bacterium]